jgi:predicted nuclease of predicted toxin-antitoxin system
MSLNILIDMNLSPDWTAILRDAGFVAVHWSTVGDPKANDRTIMEWAEANGHLVFTHDLDFGTILALTHKTGPSVIQVRGENVLPDYMANLVINALRQHEQDLKAGALVVVDQRKNRVRVLPL